MDLNQVKELAAKAIRQVLSDEIGNHGIHGYNDYQMSEEAQDLVREARLLGIGPLEPYEGYSYMPQVAGARDDI